LKNGEFKLWVTIPPNTTASVFVPGSNIDDVSVDNSNVDFIGVEKDFLHYEVPSGKYQFISRNIAKLMKTPMLSIPVIDPPDSTLFSPDSVLVNIRQYSKDAEIRYTLDGTKPNENSELYTQPFALEKSAVIKARTFKKGFKPSFTKTNRIVFIDSLKNGLHYNYYLGNWIKLPDFSKLRPVRSGKVFNISLDEFDDLAIAFGLVLSGEIEINEGGSYTFYLSSNDGSKLFIDDKEIIDYDGLHQSSFKNKKINLNKGRHKIKLEYFQAGGGRGLELLFESNKIEKQYIPADVLIFK